MKILNKLWVNDIGIITVDRGDEVKTYIGKCHGSSEAADVDYIVNVCPRIYPEQLQRIIDLHNAKAAAQTNAEAAND